MRILIVGGKQQSLVLFRGSLLQAMVANGHQVSAAAGEEDLATTRELTQMGITFYPFRLGRASLNPFTDIATMIDLAKICSQVLPDIIFAYTIKPVIYSGIVSSYFRVSTHYSLITGLGYAFAGTRNWQSYLSHFVAKFLYRFSLKNSQLIFFQNPDNQKLFLDLNLLKSTQARLVNGSGVDLSHYSRSPLPTSPIFLLIARLLIDKGVREYVEAAARVKSKHQNVRFILVGDVDPNPASIKLDEVDAWQKLGIVEYVGPLEDVRPMLKICSCYILPSYHEGLPRTVLEAMATGRPIITTDVPGCRETVALTEEGKKQQVNGEDVMIGENGFLIRPRSISALETAILRVLESPELLEPMADRSYQIAKEKFDVHKVNYEILNYMGLIASNPLSQDYAKE